MSHKTATTAAHTIGIDTGKNTHLIGLDDMGAIVLREKIARGRITARLANVPRCLIGLEAGMATHYVARELSALGHDVKQVPPAPRMIRIMEDLSSDWRRLDERIQHVTEEIEVLAHGSESCRQLMTVPGIGPLIASAMVAAIGNGAAFAKGRDFAAWLGLVPKQISTGDRTILGRITKWQSLSTHDDNAGRARYSAQASKLGKAQFGQRRLFRSGRHVSKVPAGGISTTYSYPSRRFTHHDNGRKGLPSQAASYWRLEI